MPQRMAWQLLAHTFFLLDQSSLLLLRPGHSNAVNAGMLKFEKKVFALCLGCSISTITFMVIKTTTLGVSTHRISLRNQSGQLISIAMQMLYPDLHWI